MMLITSYGKGRKGEEVARNRIITCEGIFTCKDNNDERYAIRWEDQRMNRG